MRFLYEINPSRPAERIARRSGETAPAPGHFREGLQRARAGRSKDEGMEPRGAASHGIQAASRAVPADGIPDGLQRDLFGVASQPASVPESHKSDQSRETRRQASPAATNHGPR